MPAAGLGLTPRGQVAADAPQTPLWLTVCGWCGDRLRRLSRGFPPLRVQGSGYVLPLYFLLRDALGAFCVYSDFPDRDALPGKGTFID